MSEKNYYSSKENTGKTKIVLTVLWVLLAVAVITGVVIVSMNITKITEEKTTKGDIASQESFSKNLLLCVKDTVNEGTKPQFLLIGFDGSTKKISVLELPAKLNITATDKKDTMQGLFEYGGVKYLAQAVENQYTIQIDSYISCSLTEVESVVDNLGGVDFDINSKMIQKNNEGNLITNLVTGTQKLNGNQFCQYLRYDSWKSDAQKAERRANLALALINEYAPNIDSEAIVSIYNAVSNKLDTNLSIINVNDFSMDFSVFQESETIAQIPDIKYSNHSYDKMLIQKYF